MKRVILMILRAVGRMPLLVSLSLTAILPFGYYSDYPDSSRFEIGVGGGFGQAASVIRDCSGGIIRSQSLEYKDVDGSASVRFRMQGGTYNVLTVRGGYFHTTLSGWDEPYPLTGADADFTYFGASIAAEGRNAGFGGGFIRGRMPTDFDDSYGFDSVRTFPTFHLRLGNAAKLHFLGSYAENLPLVSGGGYLNLGFGYPVGRGVRLYTGASALPYDHIGFLQQADIRLNQQWSVNVAGRYGESAGIFEGSLSAALRFRFGKR